MNSLSEIARKYGTDKEVSHESHGEGHRFCDFYDFHLSSIRNNNLKVLEIGIFDGASLRMWEEYFPNSKIYGIDNLAHPKAVLVNSGRIKSFKVDAGDRTQLENFVKAYGDFDIVIDDASHFTDHQFLSWDIFYGKCKIFIWEDLHTSRIPDYMRLAIDNKYPLDYAKHLSITSPNNHFIFDRDNDSKHVTFIRKNL